MDASGLDDLPRAYRLGLSLRALGADDQLIADCLEIEVDSVGVLLDIGARKLKHVQDAQRLTRTMCSEQQLDNEGETND